MRLVITCARPGLIRGGVRHPKSAEHLLRDFSPDQLREMLSEPELALTLGRPLTYADVAAIEVGAFSTAIQGDERAATEASPEIEDVGATTSSSAAGAEGKPAAPAKRAKGRA